MARPRGRPPLDAASASPSADVHLKLAATEYARVERLAKQWRTSPQAVIRRSLKRLLNER